MIKLGANTVLFAGFDLATAMEQISRAGYDGVELAAIRGMCEHLDLDDYRAQAPAIRELAQRYGLELLAMEVASLEEERLTRAYEAGRELGIPVVNVGPGGRSGVEEDFERQVGQLQKMADKAAGYGVVLCAKAHVGQCIHDTPTTLRAMERISSPSFGVDMDPSHIFRAAPGENPVEALEAVISRVAHVHIRDCREDLKGTGGPPGPPEEQACGRGGNRPVRVRPRPARVGDRRRRQSRGDRRRRVRPRARVGDRRGEPRVPERLPEGVRGALSRGLEAIGTSAAQGRFAGGSFPAVLNPADAATPCVPIEAPPAPPVPIPVLTLDPNHVGQRPHLCRHRASLQVCAPPSPAFPQRRRSPRQPQSGGRRPENLHLTLRFLGDTPEEQLDPFSRTPSTGSPPAPLRSSSSWERPGPIPRPGLPASSGSVSSMPTASCEGCATRSKPRSAVSAGSGKAGRSSRT